jgi:D-alanyl-D-alanine carboxypeptidase (penicillin-binding protein 5/6)
MIMSLKTSIAVVLAACFTMFSASALAEEPQIDAQSACVIDSATGNELYAKNADQRMYPGGTTMMMTSILGVESGKLDTVMTVSDASQQLAGDVSRLGIYPGDKVTLRNALTGMMTVGGCDVAYDAAVTVSPSLDSFVQSMNEKAACYWGQSYALHQSCRTS